MARAALGELCAAYWYPLYAFVRRSGQAAHEAEDLTQEFFARLMVKDALGAVDRSKGKFRAFLLAAMKHFLAKQWHREQAQKRGGGVEIVPLEFETAEARYQLEPADTLTPELLYERRWALTVLENVFTALRQEVEAAGKTELYAELKDLLPRESRAIGYAEVAMRLGMSEAAVKVTIYRLRKRYRDLLRAEIAETVGSAADVEEELRDLVRIFAAV